MQFEFTKENDVSTAVFNPENGILVRYEIRVDKKCKVTRIEPKEHPALEHQTAVAAEAGIELPPAYEIETLDTDGYFVDRYECNATVRIPLTLTGFDTYEEAVKVANDDIAGMYPRFFTNE